MQMHELQEPEVQTPVCEVMTSIHLLPQDIMNMIISFMKTTNVFATTMQSGTGHSDNDEIINQEYWNMVASFI